MILKSFVIKAVIVGCSSIVTINAVTRVIRFINTIPSAKQGNIDAFAKQKTENSSNSNNISKLHEKILILKELITSLFTRKVSCILGCRLKNFTFIKINELSNKLFIKVVQDKFVKV